MSPLLVDMINLLISLFAGGYLKSAWDLWLRHSIHDSVLRYAYLKPADYGAQPQMHTLFCAIVNGKAERLDRFGCETGDFRSKIGFYFVVLFVMAVIGGIYTVVYFAWLSKTQGGGFKFVPLCILGAALLIWLYCWIRLRYRKHHTIVITERGSNRLLPWGRDLDWKVAKWVKLTAERDAAGIPSVNLDAVPGEGALGLW
jgi:hypothetical protein